MADGEQEILELVPLLAASGHRGLSKSDKCKLRDACCER